MAIRRPRNHTSGVSNADNRSAPQSKEIRRPRVPLFQSSYPHYKAKMEIGRVSPVPVVRPDPIQSQLSYYSQSNRSLYRAQSYQRVEYPYLFETPLKIQKRYLTKSVKPEQISPPRVVLPQIYNKYQKPISSLPNRKKYPLNKLEYILDKSLKLKSLLKQNYKKKDTFQNQLASIGNNQQISYQKVRQFLKSAVPNINQNQIEAFLDTLNYNIDGCVSVKQVGDLVFSNKEVAKQKAFAYSRPTPPIRNSSAVRSRTSLKRILQDIQHKTFTQGSQNSVNIFRSFDRDRDGYITIQDLQEALKKLQIQHSPLQTQELMAFLDKNKKGYVQYTQFCQSVKPNILDSNSGIFQKRPEVNLYQPSLNVVKYQKNIIENFNRSDLDRHLKEKQEERINKVNSNTRYSSKPIHQDTFVNHVPIEKSALSALTKQRFFIKRVYPINLGHEDKAKKSSKKQSRLQYLSQVRQSILTKMTSETVANDLKEEFRLKKKQIF